MVAKVASNGDLKVWEIETNDLVYLRPDPADDPALGPGNTSPPELLASAALRARGGESAVRKVIDQPPREPAG